jgi:hypothetical protein
MPYNPTTDDLIRIIEGLQRRIEVLENTNALQRNAISNDAGQVMFEVGVLSARGISPGGQFGPRAWDASGNLLFDPNTLSNVGKLLGINAAGPAQNVTSTSYIALTPNITIPFTLAYPTRCRFNGFMSAKSTVAGKTGYVRIALYTSGGTLIGNTGDIKFGGGGGAMDTTDGYADLFCAPGSSVGTLAAGSYNCRLEARADAAGNLFFDQGYVEGEITSPAAF